jgi:phosphoglycerate dehydrogenase-like enzyme
LTESELIACIGEYDALVTGSPRRLTGSIIEQGVRLKAIGYAASRLDNVDVSAARGRGIEVFNAPATSSIAIAEQTFSQLLALAASFGDGRLAGKTLGLVGFGAIGRQVANRARAFNMQVLANQPRLTSELVLAGGVQSVDLLELLHRSDYVSLHLPFNAETKTILGRSEIWSMKQGACVINTGNVGLIDNTALLEALDSDRLNGASFFVHPSETQDSMDVAALKIRQHARVISKPYRTQIIESDHDAALREISEQIADFLNSEQASSLLSLQVIAIDQVSPHEEVDEKRVARLKAAISDSMMLIDPPIATYWNGRYVILDGATRFTSYKQLGFEHMVFQVVDAQQDSFTLHTWYHAISSDYSFGELLVHLQEIEHIAFERMNSQKPQTPFQNDSVLCYLVDREEHYTLIKAEPGLDRMVILNQLVAAYTAWGRVERTLVTDVPRLIEQFPDLTAVAIFPQFSPETVFTTASRGDFVPAGLTRFVIPGRILRLNMKLDRIRESGSLASKRAWFKKYLSNRLTTSRLRYYQEPVVILDK